METILFLEFYSGLAFNRANKTHLIRCDLTNFDETNAIIRDLKVDIFENCLLRHDMIHLAGCNCSLCC